MKKKPKPKPRRRLTWNYTETTFRQGRKVNVVGIWHNQGSQYRIVQSSDGSDFWTLMLDHKTRQGDVKALKRLAEEHAARKS